MSSKLLRNTLVIATLIIFAAPVACARRPAKAGRPSNRDKEYRELIAQAERLVDQRRYRAARAKYEYAASLFDNYTQATNALGDLHFFVLEDHARALKRYEQSLRTDPTDLVALLGAGKSLHFLWQQRRSNEVLDLYLKYWSEKGSSLSKANHSRGQAHYYKARNFYFLLDQRNARAEIDLAKNFIPEWEQVDFLSAQLLLNAKKYEEANAQFHRVAFAKKPICRASYFLGWSYFGKNDQKFMKHILDSYACEERRIKNVRKRLHALKSLDVEPAERTALARALREKIEGYKTMTMELEHVIDWVRQSSSENRLQHIQQLEKMARRISAFKYNER